LHVHKKPKSNSNPNINWKDAHTQVQIAARDAAILINLDDESLVPTEGAIQSVLTDFDQAAILQTVNASEIQSCKCFVTWHYKEASLYYVDPAY